MQGVVLIATTLVVLAATASAYAPAPIRRMFAHQPQTTQAVAVDERPSAAVAAPWRPQPQPPQRMTALNCRQSCSILCDSVLGVCDRYNKCVCLNNVVVRRSQPDYD